MSEKLPPSSPLSLSLYRAYVFSHPPLLFSAFSEVVRLKLGTL